MTLIRLILSNQGLKLLRALQLATALVAIAGVGFNTYRLFAATAEFCQAQAELKRCKAVIATTTANSYQSELATFGLCTVEPASEYPKFISTFIRQVTELAGTTGCTLKTISPKPAQSPVKDKDENVRFRPVEVEMDMSATFAGVEKFIDGLSRLPKVTKVTKISLSRQAVDWSARKIKLDTKLSLVLCLIEPAEK